MESPRPMGGHKPLSQRWSGLPGVLLVFAPLAISPAESKAAPPLHEQIDACVEETHPETAPVCGDGEFLRRAHLDFLGWLPSSQDARAFLADPAPDKRARWIDKLLADPQHAMRLATTLDLWLMERRAPKHTKAEDFRKWLWEEAKAKTPWDKLVTKLLTADGADEKQRHVARWILDRDADPHLLTKDVGRIFLGMDMGCAQCHDHPRVPDYTQRDYYGLNAFFSRTYLFQPDEKKPAVVGERAEGEATWTSVFTKVSGSSLPGLFGGQELRDPPVKPEELWVVAPNEKDKMVRPIPKHSRRAELPARLTASRPFARNLANRLWAMLMGRGLVEPVDMTHSANPAASAKALDCVADAVAANGFDIDKTLRELALTRVYQRAGVLPASPAQPSPGNLADLETEARRAEEAERESASALAAPRKAWEEKQKAAEAIMGEWKAAMSALAEPRKAVEAAVKAHQDAEAGARTKKEQVEQFADAINECVKAAELVGDAGQLMNAAMLLVERQKKARTEIPALDQAVTAKFAELEAKRKILAEGEGKADAIKERENAARQEAAKTLAALNEASRAAAGARETARVLAKKRDAAKAALEYVATASQERRQDATARGERQREQFVLVAFQKAEVLGKQLPQDPQVTKALAEVRARRDQGAAKLAQAEKSLADAKTASQAAAGSLTNHWASSFALSPLTALTPEQLCWSIMRTTGVMEQVRAGAAAEWDKKTPLSDADKKDPAKVAARDAAVEALFWEKMRGNENQFVSLFGHSAGSPQSDFFATADQALFFENGGALRSWLSPSGENLTGRLMKLEDAKAVAEELYLSVLTRMPSAEETAEVAKILAESKPETKAESLVNLGWALMTSAEFRFKP